MDEFRKERIISAGIVEAKDWGGLAPEHIALADAILTMLDLQKTDPESEMFSCDSFKSQEQHSEELEKIITELNDRSELEDVDRVEPNKTFKEGMPIAIPISLVPFFNNLLRDEN